MDALPQDKKKLAIYVGIIAVCLIGAVVAYSMMSGDSAPKQTGTEERMDEITKKMNEAAPPAEPAPMPTVRRGAAQAPK